MTFRTVLVTCVLVLNYTFAIGQTSRDVEASYGRHQNVFSVSEHLWMTPEYGADGQLCMMRVYPKLVSANTNYLDAKFEIDEALKFINTLAPIQARGARQDGFGMSTLGGGVVWTGFDYEHIRFVFISTFRLDKLPERQPDRPDEAIDFPIDEKAQAAYRREQALQSDDNLMRKYAPGPKLLEIYWQNRQCVRP